MKSSAIEASEYKGIWEVLRALLEQDADLADVVKHMGQVGSQETGFHDKTLDEYIHISASARGIEELINVKILDNLSSLWDTSYRQLKQYLIENPQDVNSLTSNRYFIAWISKQKELHKKGLLPLDKQKLLEDLGVNLTVRVITDDQRWHGRYNELKEYYKKNKNCYTDPNGLPAHLRAWSSMCREKTANKTITPEQIKLLQEIHFPANVINAKWDILFEEYKTLLASGKMTKKWYDWEFRQKVDFKINKMSQHRLDALKSIGFNFNYDENFDWASTPFNEHEHYEQFRALIKKHGFIPSSEPSGIRAIGKKLKRLYAKGQLAQATIEILNKMGFILESNIDARFERNIRRYLHYKENKLSIKRGSPVATWITAARKRKKQGKLDAHIIKRLNEAGFDWGKS